MRSITQDGTTQTFELDPLLRVYSKTKSGGTSSTESYAYTDDTDSPAFTQISSSNWSRTVDGIMGAEAVQTNSGVSLMLQNLRGDVVAQSSTSGVLSNLSRVDEFGVPKGALPGGVRYAFHGSKQREAVTGGGIVMMGVRLYQPQQGRFLQVDPVLGGSATAYDYADQDPVNVSDVSGNAPAKCWISGARAKVTEVEDLGDAVDIHGKVTAHARCTHKVRNVQVHVKIGSGGFYGGRRIGETPFVANPACNHGRRTDACSGSVGFHAHGVAPQCAPGEVGPSAVPGQMRAYAYVTWTDSRGRHHRSGTFVDYVQIRVTRYCT